MFLSKKYLIFDKITESSNFEINPRSRIPLITFMSCKNNFKSLCKLIVEGESGNFLLYFNLMNDSLVCESLDDLLEEIKNLYYGSNVSSSSETFRYRIIELLGFINSELFHVILSKK